MKTCVAAVLVLGLAAGAPVRADEAHDPLLAPIAPDYAARWAVPQEPRKIYGNTYLVGFTAMNVGLIRTDDGLILIDAALPQSVRALETNIRKLGFQLKDVKYILSTEPHFDHAGGLAAMARDTGATVVASAAGAEVLRRGASGPDDPQDGSLARFPPVAKVQVVRDGETLRLGKTLVTARATPSHTAGAMSWAWRSCEKDKCLDVVFGSSLNPISTEGYRFSAPEHADIVAAQRRAFQTMRGLPCDILLTAHPEHSDGEAKYKRLAAGEQPNPFVDPRACSAFADKYEAILDKRLAKEAASP